MDNPVRGLRKRHLEVAKDRVLSDDEIVRFWTATATAAPAFRTVLRLILLTAQRPGECAGIRAEEVDLANGLWRLPAARVKNKRPHVVPLVGEARAIVKSLLDRAEGRGPLLITPRGHVPNTQDVATAFKRLRAGLFETPVTPHDLRRTAATLMGRLEVDRMTIAHVLEPCLDHEKYCDGISV